MDHNANPPDLSTTRNDEVEWREQIEAVESMQCCCRRTVCPAWLADIDHQAPQLSFRRQTRARESEGVRTNAFEPTLAEPCRQTFVCQTDRVRLLPTERPRLAARDRHDVKVGIRHADVVTARSRHCTGISIPIV